MFEKSKIDKMKVFFNENFNKEEGKMVCIVTLNHGIRILYNDMKLRLGSQIDHSMKSLEEMGKIRSYKVLEFLDKNNKKTTGVTEPHQLITSVYETLLEMIGSENGNFVFGLSIMDGYHSVTIIVEKNNDKIDVYRCDQNEGCVKNNKNELDGYITSKTNSWWNKNAEKGTKMKTRTTLWLLQQ